MAPLPMRQLSMLPPVWLGGTEFTQSASLGARPMTPKCGRIGIRTPFQHVPVAHRLAVVDGQPGIVDRRMLDAERIDDRRPAEIVDRTGPVAFARRVELVDRHHLALLAGQEIVVVEAPVRGGVAAEGEAREFRIETGPRRHVDDAHLEDVARLGAAHQDGAGADVDAQPLAVALAGATARHALPVPGPEIDALRAGIALDHALVIVARLMRERLDGDEVPGLDLELRFQVLAEETPMHRVGVGRQIVMAGRRGLPCEALLDGAESPPAASAAAPPLAAKVLARKARRSRAMSSWNCR